MRAAVLHCLKNGRRFLRATGQPVGQTVAAAKEESNQLTPKCNESTRIVLIQRDIRWRPS